jgi:hypothetical protein
MKNDDVLQSLVTHPHLVIGACCIALLKQEMTKKIVTNAWQHEEKKTWAIISHGKHSLATPMKFVREALLHVEEMM